MKPAVLLALGLLAAMPARAEIYMCEEDGKKVFSQQPCGQQARPMTLSNQMVKLTLPEVLDVKAAEDVCHLFVGAWDALSANNRNTTRYGGYGGGYRKSYMSTKRITEYVAQRVSNYSDRMRADRSFYPAMDNAARMLISLARDEPALTADLSAQYMSTCSEKLLAELGENPANSH